MNDQKRKLVFLDASSLGNYGNCPRALYYNNYLGLRINNLVSAPLHFGSCYHIFAEHYIKSGDFTLALSKAQAAFAAVRMEQSKLFKHLDAGFLANVCLTAQRFMDEKQFEFLSVTDPLGVTRWLCEIKFVEPLIVKPGIAILMSGTADMCIKYRGGQYVIADWKTTNSVDIDKYLASYNLSAQLLAYRWFIWIKSKKYPRSIYAKMGDKIGTQIFAIATSAPKMGEVTKSEVFTFSEDHILAFDKALRRRAEMLLDHLEKEEVPPMEGLLTGECAPKFGMCQYVPLCNAVSDEHRDGIMSQRYICKPYNPLEFR